MNMFDHGNFLRAGHGEMLQAKPPRLHWARITYVSVAIYHYSVYPPRTWNNLRFHCSRWTWSRFIYILNKETSPTWSPHRILEPTPTYQCAPLLTPPLHNPRKNDHFPFNSSSATELTKQLMVYSKLMCSSRRHLEIRRHQWKGGQNDHLLIQSPSNKNMKWYL